MIEKFSKIGAYVPVYQILPLFQVRQRTQKSFKSEELKISPYPALYPLHLAVEKQNRLMAECQILGLN